MKDRQFPTLKSPSLKELFVREIERMIISGELKIGERLPPERELCSMMTVSRSVVNAGIIELASKGFLTVVPRQGTFVADYRRKGSVGILTSIMNYHGGNFDRQIFQSLMDIRRLIEIESVALAAEVRTEEDLHTLEDILSRMSGPGAKDMEVMAEQNFLFHHTITVISGNILYALVIGSFEPLCLELIRKYLRFEGDVEITLGNHRALLEAIRKKDPASAQAQMKLILGHGADILSRLAR